MDCSEGLASGRVTCVNGGVIGNDVLAVLRAVVVAVGPSELAAELPVACVEVSVAVVTIEDVILAV